MKPEIKPQNSSKNNSFWGRSKKMELEIEKKIHSTFAFLCVSDHFYKRMENNLKYNSLLTPPLPHFGMENSL